jgi:hypothetical protein
LANGRERSRECRIRTTAPRCSHTWTRDDADRPEPFPWPTRIMNTG